MPDPRRLRVLPAAAALLVAGCAADAPATQPDPPVPSISTLSALPMPDMGPPEGRLVADLRQSSRDVALGRFQVWVGNGLDREVNPGSITYADARYRETIAGERLRPIPAGSERGYPLALPDRPVCHGADRPARGALRVDLGGRSVRIRVADEADVVARHVAARCLELAVSRVATLSFDEEVPVDGAGEGSTATLRLRVAPSGRPGGVLRIEQVTGTPLLTPATGSAWVVGTTVRSDGRETVLELPVVPARCDGHVFLESGGATAFRVALRVDGRAGDLLVRMPPAGAANAIGFARDSCGL